AESLPKWRLEQEEQRVKREQELSRQIAETQSSGDVLQVFDAALTTTTSQAASPMSERARGVAEEVDDLLPAEVLAAPARGAAAPRTPEPVKVQQEPVKAPEPVKVQEPVKVPAAPSPAPVPVVNETPAPVVRPEPVPVAAAAPAPVVTPESAPSSEPTQLTLMDLGAEEPTTTATTTTEPTLQLELLPEPEELKRVG
ncbi:MAG: hypothetical protein ACREUC_10725, partial [Steroidobacteraceae bacterium]